jgi:hypothetical protein
MGTRAMALPAPRPAALGLLLLIGGCHVTLISPYDEATDKGVSAIQRSVQALTSELDQSPVPTYASTRGHYDGIRAELGALQVRNGARQQNELTVRQLGDLKAILDKLEELHKTDKLIQPMIGPSRDALEQALRAILKLELAKKELT